MHTFYAIVRYFGKIINNQILLYKLLTFFSFGILDENIYEII